MYSLLLGNKELQSYVGNLSQNLNITDGANNGMVDLKTQKLNVAGANGVTVTVNNQTITVGLDTNVLNATQKDIELIGNTGFTGYKYLKDGDVSFAIMWDDKLVITSATVTGVKVDVNTATITAGADGTANTVNDLSNTTWNGIVVSGRAATEAQLKQVSDVVNAGWNVNTGTVVGSSGVSTGAASTKVSSREEVNLQAGNNMIVFQPGKTISYALNSVLSGMTSATFTNPAGNTTVINGNGITITPAGEAPSVSFCSDGCLKTNSI